MRWRRITTKEKWLRFHTTNEWHDYYTEANVDDLRRFFDHYLKGEDNGWEQTPPVRMSLLNPGGTEVRNRPEQAYPLERTQRRRLYLDARDGLLLRDPVDDEGLAVYDSDGARADVPAVLGTNGRAARRGKTVFTFRVDEPFELCGPIAMHLWVSPLDADDMDLRVTLEKRSPHGLPYLGQPGSEPKAVGFARLSLRDIDEAASTPGNPIPAMTQVRKVKPGAAVPVDIMVRPLGMLFEKGQVVRLTVQAHKTDPTPRGPMARMFGRAKLRVAADRFTYTPRRAGDPGRARRP